MDRGGEHKTGQSKTIRDADRRRRERELDEGLEETFPASDPVNITLPQRSSIEKREERKKGR
jgi:hypothetical protein